MTNQNQFRNYWDILKGKGPPREEIFDACRLQSERREVSFTLRLRGSAGTSTVVLIARVGGISAEDGSGENWIIRLYPNKNKSSDVFGDYPSLEAFYKSTPREGYVRAPIA